MVFTIYKIHMVKMPYGALEDRLDRVTENKMDGEDIGTRKREEEAQSKDV